MEAGMDIAERSFCERVTDACGSAFDSGTRDGGMDMVERSFCNRVRDACGSALELGTCDTGMDVAERSFCDRVTDACDPAFGSGKCGTASGVDTGGTSCAAKAEAPIEGIGGSTPATETEDWGVAVERTCSEIFDGNNSEFAAGIGMFVALCSSTGAIIGANG